MGSHISRSAPATPTSNADFVAQEIAVAFLDLEKDATNSEKLVEFVRSYYVNRLNAPEFCAALQQRLNPTNEQVHNFIHDLSSLYSAHSTTEKALKSMDESFIKQLRCIAVSKKVSVVLFTAAAVICAAVAAANANATPKGAAAAGAASILLGSVGKWIHSVLNKRESTLRKYKEVAELMIMGAKFGMKDLRSKEHSRSGSQDDAVGD